MLLLYAEELFFTPNWARRGGMGDRIEVYGSDGLTSANLHMGNALPTYSEDGYGYAVEKHLAQKDGATRFLKNCGITFPAGDGALCSLCPWQEQPQSTGEDELVVMKALHAAYASAGQGRKITMPFEAKGIRKPIDLWFRGPH